MTIQFPFPFECKNYIGYVESITRYEVIGWLRGLKAQFIGHIQIEFGCTVVGRGAINISRPDVNSALDVDGNSGFVITVDRSNVVIGLTSGYTSVSASQVIGLTIKAYEGAGHNANGDSAEIHEVVLIQRFETLNDWMDLFGIEFDQEIFSARQAIYANIAKIVDPSGHDRKAIADEQSAELHKTSMVWSDGIRISNNSDRDAIVGRYFDSDYYLTQYTDVRDARIDPLQHYLSTGAAEQRNPHPLFDAKYYLDSIKSEITDMKYLARSDPFYFFLTLGGGLDADPHVAFSTKWYREKYSFPVNRHPWIDYVTGGWHFGREPNCVFDTGHFLRKLGADGRSFSNSPLEHFLKIQSEGDFVPHCLLDSGRIVDKTATKAAGAERSKRYLAYLKTAKSSRDGYIPFLQGDIYRAQVNWDGPGKLDAVQHYFATGENLGLKPNVLFDPDWYRRKYRITSDIRGPLVDFLTEGEARFNDPSPLFSTEYYLSRNKDVALAGMHMTTHFLIAGDRERRRPNKRFHSEWYSQSAKLTKSDYPYRLFLLSKFSASPHPTLIVSERSTPDTLKNWLFDDNLVTTTRPPFGVCSVLEKDSEVADALLNRGYAVPSLIDDFEDRLARFSPKEIALLRLPENIARVYDHYDLARSDQFGRNVISQFAEKHEGHELPLVSVIMPVRNRATVVGRAIESVLRQTYGNLELVVIDDGSTDQTASVIAGFADERVVLIRQSQSGVSAARNTGLAAAKGVYILYLDSDNYWELAYVEVMVKGMLLHGFGAAHAALRVFTENRVYYRGDVYDRDAMDRENYIDMNIFAHHRKFVDSGLHFDESLKRCVDWDFIRRLCLSEASQFFPFPGCNYVDDSGELQRITNTELVGDFYKLSIEQMDLGIQTRFCALREKPQYTIVWPIHREEQSTIEEEVWAAVRHLKSGDHELIIINNALPDRLTALLDVLAKSVSGLRVVHLWRTFLSFPAGNIGGRLSKGERILFWEGHVAYDAARIDAFMETPSPRSVEFPLVVDQAGKVVENLFTTSSSATPIEDVAIRHFPDASVEELFGVGSKHFPVAMARDAFLKAGGFDTSYCNRLALGDLILKIWRADPQDVVLKVKHRFEAFRPRVNVGSDAIAAKEAAWFQWNVAPVSAVQVALSGDDFGIGPLQRRYLVSNGQLTTAPVSISFLARGKKDGGLFVQIMCPAPAGPNASTWGDYHFALSLKAAIETAGHRCKVQLRDHWDRPTLGVDIVLHLRGIVDVRAVPGATNILWIISHPDKIRNTELEGMAGIIACSKELQNDLRLKFGVESIVLPQATDASRFAFIKMPPLVPLAQKFLFVGNSRREPRQIVIDAIKLNLALEVYGNDWEYFITKDFIRGDHIENSALADWYRSARCVLNDHWPNMAQAGIVSNRLFDVVSCGGVAITDSVVGVDELFGKHVQSYSSRQELAELAQNVDDWAPGLAARRAKSREILAQHSFEVRARQILAFVFDI